MNPAIAIIIPVLNRPRAIMELVDSIRRSTTVPHHILFMATIGDDEEIRELKYLGLDYLLSPSRADGDYAAKINEGYRQTTEPYIFTAADDLIFHPGWDIAALDKFTDGIGVVGTNDLGNPAVIRGQHSTHSLVSRVYADTYGTIDGGGSIYCELYHHLFIDDELVSTAKSRNAWAFAPDSHVEHFHPHLKRVDNGAPKAEMDSTYRIAFARTAADKRLFRIRERKWKTSTPQLQNADVTVIIGTFGDESWVQTMQEVALPSVGWQRLAPKDVIPIHDVSSLAKARNIGAQLAQTEWLIFLDADDELHPAYVSMMQPHFAASRADILVPAVQFVVDGRQKPKKMFRQRPLDQGNYIVIGAPVRREMFLRVGGFDPQWEAWEDWQVWRKVQRIGGRISRVPNAVYVANWSGEGRNNTIADKEGLRARMLEEFDQWESTL